MRKEVAEIASRQDVSEERAFAIWYGIHGLMLDELEAVEAASYDGGNDRGIDIFVVDDELERVVIGQTKYLKQSNKAPKLGELALLLDVLDELADPQEYLDAGRPDLAEAAEALAEARERGYAIQLHFVYPGNKKDELDRKIRQFNRKNSADGATAGLLKLEDLELLAVEANGEGSRVPEAEIRLSEAAFHEETGKYGRSLVATIAGSELKRLYQDHGNRMFDQNVRLFLGARKGTVNAGIRDTLQSPSERTSFWAYNNGLDVSTDPSQSHSRNQLQRAHCRAKYPDARCPHREGRRRHWPSLSRAAEPGLGRMAGQSHTI